MKTKLLIGLVGVLMAMAFTFAITSNVLADDPKPKPTPKAGAQANGIKGPAVVKAIQGSVITISTKEGDKTVITNAQTVFTREKKPATLATLKVGDRVKVKGAVAAAGTIAATSIEIKLPEIEGAVATIEGTLITVTSKDGTKSVVTNAQTTFTKAGQPASLADVKVGNKIEAKGTVGNDGRLAAELVKIEVPHAPGQKPPHPQGTPKPKK